MSGFSLVAIGLSLSSSWGNGHATTYRALLRALADRGADIAFLERDVPWYRDNRDLPDPDFARLELYGDLSDLRSRFAERVRQADAVLIGSYVPEGTAVIDWVMDTATAPVAFYDIDTPVTLARLARNDEEYIAVRQVPLFDIYLSFTGGPTLDLLRTRYRARATGALYCSVDTDRYRPDTGAAPPARWDLGYLGTYSEDRQPTLQRLLIDTARRRRDGAFAVAGPQYPPEISWPGNVERIEHLPPQRHPDFYNRQAFTLNVTRTDMIAAGWSPSVRLFEAAACATPVISDRWAGLDDVFPVGEAILIADSTDDVLDYLDLPEGRRRAIGRAARDIVLERHGADVRAQELESFLQGARERQEVTA